MQQTFPGLLKVLQAITNEEGLRDNIVKAIQEEPLAWLEHGLTRTMKIYGLDQEGGDEDSKGYAELLASIRKARQQLGGG